MAGKFNQQEKEHIHSRLLQEGRDLFMSLGLKKTSISDLTKQCGIAQGTFYLFFQSKEALYFEILELEEQTVREQLIKKLSAEPVLTRSAFQTFLQDALCLLSESPLLRQLFDQTVMEQLLRKLPPEKLAGNEKGDIAFLVPYIEKWQAAGTMKELPPAVIVSMIRSLILLSLQKHLIGDTYEEMIEQLTASIADRLVLETT